MIETHEHTDDRGLAEHINDAVDGSLRRRVTPRDTNRRAVEDRLKAVGAKLWVELKRHPYLGVGVAGAAGIALAGAIGVGELAVGVAVAYGAFNVLVRGESPEEAAREVAHELEEA